MKLLEHSILDEQIHTELYAVDEGVARYHRLKQEAVNRGDGASLKPAQRLLLWWFDPLVLAIAEEKRQIRDKKRARGRSFYGPVLLSLPDDVLAVVTIHTVLSRLMSMPAGERVIKLDRAVGRAVLAEVNLSLLKDLAKDERRENKVKRADDPNVRLELDAIRRLDKRFKSLDPHKVNWFAKKTLNDPVWSIKVCTQVGACLRWMLQAVAPAVPDLDEFEPAFYRHNVKGRKGGKMKHQSFIRMDDRSYRIIEDGHMQRQYMRPRYEPMLVRPYPWSETAEGGYTRIRTPFISKPIREQKRALHEGDLSVVHDCLNAVNATPWRINKRMLGIVEALVEQGGGVAGVPHMRDFPMPPKVEDESEASIKRNKADRAKTWDKNFKLRAERIEFWNKIGVARRFADRERFYEPHQFCFRGRTYPVPPHLQHQGDDLCRGLLEFGESRSVDGDAYKAIQVQAANHFGFDKASFDDRVRWAETNSDAIHACADDPFAEQWWTQADDPLQFLATCIALVDPRQAEHFPIKRDGTCNGLQHYAALSRDAEGAALVNMIPGDKPNDVYTVVCEAAAKIVRREGDKHGIIDKVIREVVKQPVMTSVYGVTMVGAREQVMGKLAKLGLKDKDLYDASGALSKIIMQAIGETCEGAAKVMDWLRDCARIVAGKQGQLVSWTTPIGFPVVQPYKSYTKFRINTVAQSLIVNTEGAEGAPPKVRQQVDGFAPNYVHSIDATHWLTTALACREAGIEIAGVHDSYWTHAATVPTMDRILREQFVELHDQDLLGDLHRQLEQGSGAKMPDPPERGDYRIETVLESPYFFS